MDPGQYRGCSRFPREGSKGPWALYSALQPPRRWVTSPNTADEQSEAEKQAIWPRGPSRQQ